MLGTDGSYPGPGGACSGYLLRCGGFTTWLEAGPGSLANLQLHIGLDELDAVVVSHAHPDHWSDLEGLYVALRYFFGRRGVPVYAPQGLRELMSGEKPDGTFDWRVVGDGDSAVLGPGPLDLVGDRPPRRGAGGPGPGRAPGRSAIRPTPVPLGASAAWAPASTWPWWRRP